MLYKIRSS